jgi:hypothetical protein
VWEMLGCVGDELACITHAHAHTHKQTHAVEPGNGTDTGRLCVPGGVCVSLNSIPFWGQVCNGPVWRETHRPFSSLISRTRQTRRNLLSLSLSRFLIKSITYLSACPELVSVGRHLYVILYLSPALSLSLSLAVSVCVRSLLSMFN